MIYADVPGGRELLAWFGEMPKFHDAEVLSLSLSRTGASELKIHSWAAESGGEQNGYKHAIVTFSLEGIMDLQLNGFSDQNVIAGLIVQRATDRGRSNYYAMEEDIKDIEIELLPCYGLDGFIRAKKLAISIVPGQPDGA
ncbi:Imm50 family immunity protein [Agrobacterium vitis]|uniref:Imm50 family immunity protein n=1 Tax=Agrobacterium vitis TaxID=373 RepID=UPI0012E7E356|nr:Imm50 family immunity protein [Agrobacterium vitis]MVA23772.1 hypothetical protein [Agrobacterium vitis]